MSITTWKEVEVYKPGTLWVHTYKTVEGVEQYYIFITKVDRSCGFSKITYYILNCRPDIQRATTLINANEWTRIS